MKIVLPTIVALLACSAAHASSPIAPPMSAGFNNNESVSKDMSKNTCNSVMPMIEAINCASYPPVLQGFCQANRPYLMTRAECDSAEAMAQAAQKGPNKEQCENLSFSAGTGSWSYVLACSWSGDFVSDQDGKQNPNNVIKDPECIEKLKATGAEFRVLGQVKNGIALGQQCIVENAISMKTTASGSDLGGWRTMTCEYALTFDKFDKQMRSELGAAKYPLETIASCRPIIDKNGYGKSVSGHGKGIAGDIKYFIRSDGSKIMMAGVLTPNTPSGQLATRARAIACSHFGLVLSALYENYRGVYDHFHTEIRGGKSTCK